jgi:hypothetical protein
MLRHTTSRSVVHWPKAIRWLTASVSNPPLEEWRQRFLASTFVVDGSPSASFDRRPLHSRIDHAARRSSPGPLPYVSPVGTSIAYFLYPVGPPPNPLCGLSLLRRYDRRDRCARWRNPPNLLGQSKHHTDSYRAGFVLYAVLAVGYWSLCRVVARSWTRSWITPGGRAIGAAPTQSAATTVLSGHSEEIPA